MSGPEQSGQECISPAEEGCDVRPVLTYPDPNKEYLLKTDALKLGLGAVLSQKQSNGRYHLIAFGSRALHGAEVNYHRTKLKFLAMKWSIEHIQTYLLHHCFKVHMDNNPLTYFLTSPNMDAKKQRWINELAKYDLSLKYQKGKNNTVADALSRISEEQLSDEEARRCSKQSQWSWEMIQFLKSSKRRKRTGDQRRLPPMLCLLRP